MTNAIFWDIKTKFVLHRRQVTYQLQSPAGFHGSVYEECRLLGYKNTVRTSQETYYVSTTEPSQLMLCEIWCFHGSDYEECRLIWYKHPVRTSQETYYVSNTEPSRLMLCKIWGIHGSDYEECCLLNVTPCASCKNWHFGGTYRLHHQRDKDRRGRHNVSGS
jgi:hypothetical protein